MEYDVKPGGLAHIFLQNHVKKNDIFNPKYFVKHCIYNPQQSVHQNAQLFLLKKFFTDAFIIGRRMKFTLFEKIYIGGQ